MPLQKARLRISDYKKKNKNKAADKNKKVAAVALSLTSMVDMFAILVIFLLTNNQTVEDWVKLDHDIHLPQAKTSDESKKATTLQVSMDGVFAEDKKQLAEISKISKGPLIIPAVKQWLVSVKEKKEGFVNILADERIPYGAIKRVISTCQESGFKNVNLAVFPKG
jgi:biopolymer transport protein ExbD